MQGALLAPGHLNALHHLVALLPQAVHLHNFLRRVLQVTVQHHHAVPLGLGQAREDGGLLAEVAGEAYAPHLGVPGGLGLDSVPGPIPGAVVDKENLVPDSLSLQQRADGIRRQGDGVLLIVGGEHHRQQSVPQRVLYIHGFISCFHRRSRSRSWGYTPPGSSPRSGRPASGHYRRQDREACPGTPWTGRPPA